MNKGIIMNSKNIFMNKSVTILSAIIIFLIVLVICVFLYFCPLFNNFPRPSGQYSVGNITIHDDNNAYNLDIFYPSTNKTTQFIYQPYKINELKKIKAENSYIPRFIWDCLLSNLYSYSEPHAPIATKESIYPVIIYLPGIGADDLHNVYLEELASHGYIVCAIEPAHDTSVTIFPNNTIVRLNGMFQKAIENNARDAIYAYRNEAHARWNDYILAAINTLKELNADKESLLYQKLDLSRLGLLGHSHGGAVVTDFCQKNNMCKAGINMDGWTKTYNSNEQFDKPFLFLLSDKGEMVEMQELFKNNNRPDFKKITVENAGHMAFNDYILIKQPIARMLGIVSANSEKVRKQISENILSFFDTYLKK
jgi:predicted dienelactone hydrolase